jgi:SAM-dependent methyltransferase
VYAASVASKGRVSRREPREHLYREHHGGAHDIRRRWNRNPDTSWDSLADWYDGWAGAGSEHHRTLAIPAILELLDLRRGEQLLDIGCGRAPLAPYVIRASAAYTGVDLSPRMVTHARERQGHHSRVLVADALDLAACDQLQAGSFDATTFLLSIQNMDPLEPVLASAAWALRPGGRLVLLLTHPCFRIPRQSGWGWDEGRRLHYRRVDRYLTPLRIPLRPPSSGSGTPASSFHGLSPPTSTALRAAALSSTVCVR